MKPAARLEPQPWMTASETRAVADALTAEGGEVRFVGGCVRDAVAGRPVKDIDIATADPPERVIALLEAAGLTAVPTGLAHGTVTAVSGGRPFEITTLRVDVETYGRHARVAFTDDWEADAARRDFTFNAMSCGLDGSLYDPFGGREDLTAGRVRFVGEAEARIREDYLRLLRFFRFQAHYGRAAPDPEGLAAARALAPRLESLSGERLRNELLRLLQAPEPVAVCRIMLASGVFAAFLPEARALERLAALIAVEPDGRLPGEELSENEPPDALRRLAALLATDAAGAEAV
ncbi:MAG: CCA tRNA nucleotidyltransferase, partial [Kiloniellales bacterium]